MYCPCCGHELKEYRPEEIEIDWTLEDSDELNRQIEAAQAAEKIGRTEFDCTNIDCIFYGDHMLWHHHPFHGINAPPGDSWSLSYIK